MPILVTCKCGKKFRADEKHAGKQKSCPKCGQSLDIAGPHVSAYDVFVSYSSKDKTTCDALVATFERKGMRCWIAPRDILPGANWGEAIIGGIEQCQAMVLVFSAHSNESPQVKREVERAVSKSIPVIPLRIEDVKLSRAMEYFISSQHWLDALTPPLENHLEELARKVARLLTDDGSSAASPGRSGPESIPKAIPVGEWPPPAPDPLSLEQPSSGPVWPASPTANDPSPLGQNYLLTRPTTRTLWARIPLVWRWTTFGSAAALLVLLIFNFLRPSADGTIKIDIPGSYANLTVKIDGETFNASQLSSPLRLKVGEHRLEVAGNEIEPENKSFIVNKGENPELQIAIVSKSPSSESISAAAKSRASESESTGNLIVKNPPIEKQVVESKTPDVATPAASPRSHASPESPESMRARKTGELWRSADSTAKILWSAYSPAGDYVAVVRDNQQVQLWPINKAQNGQQSFTVTHPVAGTSSLVTGITFSPDGRLLATAAKDGSIFLWSLESTPPRQMAQLRPFDRFHHDVITALAFSPSRNLFAAGVRKPGGSIHVWDVVDPTTPREVFTFRAGTRKVLGPDRKELIGTDAVASIAFSNDSTIIYVGTGGPRGIKVLSAALSSPPVVSEIWSSPDGKIGGWARSLHVSPDGKELGFGAEDKGIILNLATKQVRLKFDGHEPNQPVIGFAFSPDGTRCLTAGYDKTIRLWSADTGLEIWHSDKPHGYNEGVSFSPDGRLAFTGSKGDLPSENVAQLWRLPDPEPAQGMQKLNIRKDDLSAESDAAPEPEWVDLFNGSDLTGWTAPVLPKNWEVRDGLIVAKGSGLSALFANETYDDFELELEYKLNAGSNSGIYVRAPNNEEVRFNGAKSTMSISLLDDASPVWANDIKDPSKRSGGLHAVAGPNPLPSAPAGKWNRLLLRAVGSQIEVTINGVQVLDVNTADHVARLPEYTGLTRTSGYIGLEDHGEDGVAFRNIRIRKIQTPPEGANAPKNDSSASKDIR